MAPPGPAALEAPALPFNIKTGQVPPPSLYPDTRTAATAGTGIAHHVGDLVGGTPHILLKEGDEKSARIVAKLEANNPLASVKDRIAKAMIDDAEARGVITPGKTTLVEATSGNTGVALAMYAAAKGYSFVVTMPAFCSLERRVLQKAFGARLILTDPAKGCIGAFEKALEVLEREPDTHMLNQFENKANPDVHYRTTGPEIWRATQGKVDIFISGVGTGGTVTGVGRFLKEQNPDIKIIAVEPTESPVISGGKHSPHLIQGMGAGFVPPVLDTALLDEVVTVSSQEALEASQRYAREKGIFVGISSGATGTAAERVAARPENAGKTIVVMFSSFGERYLSTALFDALKKEAEDQEFEPWVEKVPFHL